MSRKTKTKPLSIRESNLRAQLHSAERMTKSYRIQRDRSVDAYQKLELKEAMLRTEISDLRAILRRIARISSAMSVE